jgi:outer membrane biosynthesis protein TonB
MSSVLALLVLGASADLARARELEKHAKHPAALEALHAAEAVEGLGREDLCDVYELEGVALASQKKPKPALESFKRLLVLCPEHKLSGHHPKNVTAAYNEAHTWAKKKGRLEATSTGLRTEDDRVLVTASINDPMGMVTLMVVDLVEDGKGRTLEFSAGQTPAHFDSSAAEVQVTLIVIGSHKQVIFTGQPKKFSRPRPAPPAPVAAAPPPAPAPKPQEEQRAPPPKPAEAPPPARSAPAPAEKAAPARTAPAPVAEPAPQRAPSPAAAERAPAAAPPEAVQQETAPRRSPLTPTRVAGIVVIGLGVVTAGVAGYFGVRSGQDRSTFSNAVQTSMQTGVSPLSYANASALDRDVRSSAWLANGLLAGAVAVAIIGAILIALGGPSDGAAP